MSNSTPSQTPVVSVIMSVKNGLPYLPETLDSVLAQTYPYWEMLIVDDGSTDGTWEVLQGFHDARISALKQENTGVATAKNRAIQNSRGRYLAIIDADDIWLPDKLEKQVDFLDTHLDHVAVGGFVDIIDYDGTYLYTEKKPVTDAEIRRHQEHRNPWTHSAVMFTRQAFHKVGGYYEPIQQYIVDYMIMYQLSGVGKVHQLPTELVQYRIVPTALSAKQNSREFDAIAHRAIRKGRMPPEDIERLRALKAAEHKTPDFKKSMYHLYLGRSYLFHNYQRRKALLHLQKALRYNPRLRIARAYWWMSALLPPFLIRWIYNTLSPIAGSTYVRKEP